MKLEDYAAFNELPTPKREYIKVKYDSEFAKRVDEGGNIGSWIETLLRLIKILQF